MSQHPIERFFKKIVLASDNLGKVREFQDMLPEWGDALIPQTVLGVEEVEETGFTFVENALIKARHASQKTGLPALADDSGLEVDVLKGAPGVYSARYAGEGKIKTTALENCEKLLEDLLHIPSDARRARFQCILVFLRHPMDPSPVICQGTWEGEILFKRQGTQGFGYDPLFYVPEYGCSAAELPLEIKNKISHRAQAVTLWKKILHSTNV